MTTGCSQAGRHSQGGAVPSFEAETKALFNYPSRGRAGGAGCQTRCTGRSQVSGLGLSGMPEDGWAWLEHRCSGDSAHPGLAHQSCGSVVPARSVSLARGCRGTSGAAEAAFSLPQGCGAALTALLGGERRWPCSVHPLCWEQGVPKTPAGSLGTTLALVQGVGSHPGVAGT